MNVAFCINCGAYCRYKWETRKTRRNVRGRVFSYRESFALCDICGNEVYAPEIADSNCVARENAYNRGMDGETND